MNGIKYPSRAIITVGKPDELHTIHSKLCQKFIEPYLIQSLLSSIIYKYKFNSFWK